MIRTAKGLLLIAAILVGVAVVVFVRFSDPELSAEVQSTRRVNGDVLILSYSPTFPDAERVLSLARETEGVTRAAAFAIWQVRVTSASGVRPGLLKLETFDLGLSRQLGLENGTTLKPRDASRPAEVAIGTLLAAELQVKESDMLSIHIAPGAGTEHEATVRTRVAAIVDWGLSYHNRQLVYADLSHRADFALHLTGIELIVDRARHRKGIATELQARLGKGYKTMTLEELMASRNSTGAK